MNVWQVVLITIVVGFIYYFIIPAFKWLHYYMTLCKRDGVNSYQLAIEKEVAYGILNFNGRIINIKVVMKRSSGFGALIHSIWNLYDFGSAMFDETIKAAKSDPELVECNYIYSDNGGFSCI